MHTFSIKTDIHLADLEIACYGLENHLIFPHKKFQGKTMKM
jgi:hypothetical protein